MSENRIVMTATAQTINGTKTFSALVTTGTVTNNGVILTVGSGGGTNPRIEFGTAGTSVVALATANNAWFQGSAAGDLCLRSASAVRMGVDGAQNASLSVLSNRVVSVRAQMNVTTTNITTLFTTPTQLYLGNNLSNRKIVFGGTQDNDHQYYGFGRNNNELRVQTNSANAAVNFYSAIDSTSSLQTAQLTGTGSFNAFGQVLSIGSGTGVANPRLAIGSTNVSEIAVCTVAANWFPNAAVGDLCVRAPGTKLLIGTDGSEVSTITINANRTMTIQQQVNMINSTTLYSTGTRLWLGNDILARKIVLNSAADNAFQYNGFGWNTGTLVMELNATATNFDIMAGTSGVTNQICARFTGTRSLDVFGQRLSVGSATAIAAPRLEMSSGATLCEIGVATGAGNWFTGSAAGDLCLRTQAGTALLIGDDATAPNARINASGISLPNVGGALAVPISNCIASNVIATTCFCDNWTTTTQNITFSIYRIGRICLISFAQTIAGTIAIPVTPATITVTGLPVPAIFRPNADIAVPFPLFNGAVGFVYGTLLLLTSGALGMRMNADLPALGSSTYGFTVCAVCYEQV